MTTHSTNPRPLTPPDHLRFTKIISSLRALEHVVTKRFMRGNVDRSNLATAVKGKLDLIQTDLTREFGPVRCSYPYCSSGGVCVLCSSE
jgi:hypothetical protein